MWYDFELLTIEAAKYEKNIFRKFPSICGKLDTIWKMLYFKAIHD